jgi:acyl-CoA dehydrogenase
MVARPGEDASPGDETGSGGETSEEAESRAGVRAELTRILGSRPPDPRLHFLGAGSDDLAEGRLFLGSLAAGGWMVPAWPEEHGGRSASPAQAAIVAQELSRFARPDLYPFMVGIGMVGPVVLAHGTAEQQRRWLPAIRSGAEIWCQLFSEPDAGSDLAALSSRAVRDGDSWRVTGSKVWSSRAHYARWGLLLARTDPAAPKHAGITAFALDMSSPGIEVRPLRQMNGDTHFNQVFLTDAPVSDGDRIGALGDGWRVAITTLAHERGSLGGGYGPTPEQLVGLAQGLGRTADPAVRQRLAQVITGLELVRQTGARARAAARQGRPPGPEGSGAKLRGSAAMKELADLALDLEGLAGLVGTGEWQTLFLTSPSLSIRGGTDEIQRNILGERVLGLPAEPRLDKGPPGTGTQ